MTAENPNILERHKLLTVAGMGAAFILTMIVLDIPKDQNNLDRPAPMPAATTTTLGN